MKNMFHVIINANTIVQHVIPIKSGAIINANVSVKSIACAMQKDDSWNPSTCICENSSYLKSIADDLVIMSDNIISVTDSVSTNGTNTISTNVTITVSIKSDNKKVRYKMDCCIYILNRFHEFLAPIFNIWKLNCKSISSSHLEPLIQNSESRFIFQNI